MSKKHVEEKSENRDSENDFVKHSVPHVPRNTLSNK